MNRNENPGDTEAHADPLGSINIFQVEYTKFRLGCEIPLALAALLVYQAVLTIEPNALFSLTPGPFYFKSEGGEK